MRDEKFQRMAFTVNEVADALNVSRRFLDKEIKAKRLRALKFGARCTRIRKCDLDDWVRASATTPCHAD